MHDPARWLVRFNSSPRARARLFCFPYAGGGASVFRSWADLLPPGVELCGVQLPGREARIAETPFLCVSEVAATLVGVIQPYLDKPFAFFGHSLGAFVCFELARLMRNQNLPAPCRLFVAGQRAPQLPDPDPPVHQLGDDEFVEEVCRRYDGIPAGVRESPELMQLLLIALRADFTMTETYQYASDCPLDCPITALGGLNDTSTTHEHLAGWAEQTTSFFEIAMFPGDHFFIEQDRALLVRCLSATFQEAAGGAAGALAERTA